MKMIQNGWGMPRPYELLIAIALLVLSLPVLAQDTVISDNQVNDVAEKMYCPVCENIPLDECRTITCLEWKEEIRSQLAEGQTEAEIIDSFIARFGDNVVGTPQDPVLRALTIIAPILTVIVSLGLGIYTFTRFSQHQKLKLENEPVYVTQDTKTDDDYRKRLEEDLLARR